MAVCKLRAKHWEKEGKGERKWKWMREEKKMEKEQKDEDAGIEAPVEANAMPTGLSRMIERMVKTTVKARKWRLCVELARCRKAIKKCSSIPFVAVYQRRCQNMTKHCEPRYDRKD
jgi:hypothetical protein